MITDWSELCDVAIAVRKRLLASERPLTVTLDDHEATVLLVAALEYSNRLAHEAGKKQ